MNLTEGFTQSFETIRHNKLRTMLTMLGMNIGVASVIAVMAIGLMGRGAIMKGIENIGSSLVWVTANTKIYPRTVSPLLMKPDDLAAIAGLTRDTAWISPVLRSTYAVAYRGDQNLSSVYGVWDAYFRVWPRSLSAGRAITVEDVSLHRKVIVLGANASRAFFSTDEEALGMSVTFAGKDFTVVGVLAKKERSPVDDGSDDDTCFVPYQALESVTNWDAFGGPRVQRIYLKVRELPDLDDVSSRVRQYLQTKYGDFQGNPRFKVNKAEDNIQTTNKVFDIITTVITLIAGISLLVGGIGIMNIMLVTVTERTKEIGIRKALGARRRDILAQFLIEAVIICLIGGGLGIILGVAITAVVSALQKWAYLLPWTSIILGLGVSIGIGLFFGIYPSMKAARLDPVVALTKE
jgi:putative ABC transport system permease protein